MMLPDTSFSNIGSIGILGIDAEPKYQPTKLRVEPTSPEMLDELRRYPEPRRFDD